MPLVTPSLNPPHPVRRPLTLSAAPGTVYGALRPDFPPLSAGDEHHPNSVVTPTTRSSRLGRRGCKTVKCSRPPPQRSHLYDFCAAHHTYNHRRKRPFQGIPVNAQGLEFDACPGHRRGERQSAPPNTVRPQVATDLGNGFADASRYRNQARSRILQGTHDDPRASPQPFRRAKPAFGHLVLGDWRTM